jgi:hypothetical protein
MPKPLEIPVALLVVNPENYRFEPVENQIEAIQMMVDDQAIKLFNIAKSIIERGTNPNDLPMVIVYAHDTSQYLVLEGNRRITALKILNNIDFLDDVKHQSLKNKFRGLLNDTKTPLPKSILCNIYDDPTEADYWIKLKHTGSNDGIGIVDWSNQANLRYQEKVEGKSSIPLQVIDLLKSSTFVDAELKKQLKDVKTSTLTRIIGDRDIKSLLGISTINGELQTDLEEKEVVKGLAQVVRNVLQPGFTVNDVYTKEDRKDYIANFPKDSQPNKSKKAQNAWKIGTVVSIDDADNEATSDSSAKSGKQLPKKRDVLIPKNCKISIVNAKVNNIYYELKNPKLSVTNFTNAVAVLLRVFIELSVDSYLESNGLITTAVTASDADISLQQKVLKVKKEMFLKKIADKNILKGVEDAVKQKDHLLGLDSWHAYVHNNKFNPDPDILLRTWDNIQDFMIILWSNIK